MKWNSCVRFTWWNNMHNQYASNFSLTLSWQRPLYRNQSIDLLCKSVDWFLHDNGLRHERFKHSESSQSHSSVPRMFKDWMFKNWPRQILSDVFILYLLVIFKSSHGRVLREIGYLKTVLIKVFEKYLQKKSLLWT